MGGSLKAESDGPGTGATFILELPDSKSAAQAGTAPEENRTNSINQAA